jgi:hypothetical protein
MPLTKNESKKILLNAFRLALAVSEKRTEDATVAYSNILDSALAQGAEDDDDMPPLISLGKPDSNIKLVISEIEQQQRDQEKKQQHNDHVPFAFPSAVVSPPDADADDYEDEAMVEALGQDKSDTEEEEETEEVEDSVVDEAEEAEESVVDGDKAEEEEDEDEEAEEDVEELELEPVRIKKVIYWKDSKSGDIYVCLPEDEVGDKVGRYVDGKPVFD